MPSFSFCFSRSILWGRFLFWLMFATKVFFHGNFRGLNPRKCHLPQEIAGPARGFGSPWWFFSSTWQASKLPHCRPGGLGCLMWPGLWRSAKNQTKVSLYYIVDVEDFISVCQNHPKSSNFRKISFFFQNSSKPSCGVHTWASVKACRGHYIVNAGRSVQSSLECLRYRENAYITGQYTCIPKAAWSKCPKLLVVSVVSIFSHGSSHHRTGALLLFSEMIISLWLIWNTHWLQSKNAKLRGCLPNEWHGGAALKEVAWGAKEADGRVGLFHDVDLRCLKAFKTHPVFHGFLLGFVHVSLFFR